MCLNWLLLLAAWYVLVVKKLRGFRHSVRTTQDIYFIFSYRLHHSSHVQTNSQNTGSTYGYMCYNQLLLWTMCYMHVVKKLRGFDIVSELHKISTSSSAVGYTTVGNLPGEVNLVFWEVVEITSCCGGVDCLQWMIACGNWMWQPGYSSQGFP